MQGNRLIGLCLVAGLALLVSGGSSVAAPRAPEEAISYQAGQSAVVASRISYQGRLTDGSGEALDGSYDMVFQLWDDPSSGSQVGSNVVRNGVDVRDGLFTVQVDVGQEAFNGQELWLRIQVGGEWLSPRQAMLPAPYALSLRPGAIVSSSSSVASLRLYNEAGGYGAVGWSKNNTGLVGVSGGSGAPVPPNGLRGVYAKSDAGFGLYAEGGHTGVYGVGVNEGVMGESSDNNGVHGISSNGTGVFGQSSAGAGVRGESDSEHGVWGTTQAGDRSGVYGFSSQGIGVDGFSEEAAGVQGRSNQQDGVVGWTGSDSTGHAGVYGHAVDVPGVRGVSTNFNGIQAVSHSPDHAALAVGNESTGPGLYAEGGTGAPAAVFRGNVRVQSQTSPHATIIELGEGLDYAEGFDVSSEAGVEPGTVLIIDRENPGELAVSGEAYDRRVAGIVAGAKGQGSGVRLGAAGFDYDVALAGRVYCNVDASYGAVAPGDLLTTSPTRGHAMKVQDYERAQGAVLGKAMEGLAEGQQGQILVLVTLQ